MIRTALKIFAALAAVFAVFYAALVVPNDRRLPAIGTGPAGISGAPQVKVFDFIDNLPSAALQCPLLIEGKQLLASYKHIQNNPAQHSHPLNLHVSLGWYPMKTLHENAIFAPAPATLAYTLRLPHKPVLKFDCGIVSSLDGKMQAPVTFAVDVVTPSSSERVYSQTVAPLAPYRWRYYDSWYKNVYKYFHPELEDRDGRWLSSSVDLSKYAGTQVTLILRTESPGQGLGFWGAPALYDSVPAEPGVSRVILVVIDSLRADHVRQEIAPNLSALAREGLSFSGALSNGNMTKLSVPSFLTSRYPFEIPEVTRHYDMSPEEKDRFYRRRIPGLASVMRQAGFRTAAMGSLSLFTDGHGFSVDLGFDEAMNLEHSGYSPHHTTSAGIEWLKKHGREKFLLMLYYEGPHGPYRPPFRYLLRCLKRPSLFANPYDLLYAGEVAYHDYYVGRLKEFLDANGFGNDTVIAVTADHGVAFRSVVYDWPGRFGAWGRKSFRFHSHGVSVTPDDLNVPFIFSGAGLHGAVARKVQLLDLAPTLLDLTGLKVPADFRGRSVLSLTKGGTFSEPFTYHQGWTNRGIYSDDGWLYIQNVEPREGFPPQSLVPEELYRLSRDAACRKNLAGGNAPELSRLRTEMYGLVPHDTESLRLRYAGAGKLNLGISGAAAVTVARGAGTPVALQGSSVEIMPGEEVFLSFEPADAAVTLHPSVNGAALSPKDVLAGKDALPLWENFTFDRALRYHSRGWPAKLPSVTGNRLFAGIVERSDSGRENLSRSPQQLKSMLEEWGYIN